MKTLTDIAPVQSQQPRANRRPATLIQSPGQQLSLGQPRQRPKQVTDSVRWILFGAIALLLASSPGLAADEYNVSTGVTLDGVPLGLRGVDSVALTSVGAVARGNAAHTVIHDGNAYYFASQSSADLFADDPEKYLPQYGGFCAYAVALGKKLDGDPRYADIVDGKLYLFVNDQIFQKYKQDPQTTLSKAEEMWPSIRHKSVGEL